MRTMTTGARVLMLATMSVVVFGAAGQAANAHGRPGSGAPPCGHNANHPCQSPPPCGDDVVSQKSGEAAQVAGLPDQSCPADGLVDNADPLCSTSVVSTLGAAVPNGARPCGPNTPPVACADDSASEAVGTVAGDAGQPELTCPVDAIVDQLPVPVP